MARNQVIGWTMIYFIISGHALRDEELVQSALKSIQYHQCSEEMRNDAIDCFTELVQNFAASPSLDPMKGGTGPILFWYLKGLDQGSITRVHDFFLDGIKSYEKHPDFDFFEGSAGHAARDLEQGMNRWLEKMKTKPKHPKYLNCHFNVFALSDLEGGVDFEHLKESMEEVFTGEGSQPCEIVENLAYIAQHFPKKIRWILDLFAGQEPSDEHLVGLDNPETLEGSSLVEQAFEEGALVDTESDSEFAAAIIICAVALIVVCLLSRKPSAREARESHERERQDTYVSSNLAGKRSDMQREQRGFVGDMQVRRALRREFNDARGRARQPQTYRAPRGPGRRSLLDVSIEGSSNNSQKASS